ncbi:MAG TPA: methyltransferase [Polyangiaceae bacterium]|nr:methyltransferase [Polyangiaceae bacterium]
MLAVLTPVLDIVRGPIESPGPPRWCHERGWAEFLLQLSDGELDACERLGLAGGLAAVAGAPAELLELSSAVQRVTRLPKLLAPKAVLSREAFQGVRARKREQLEVLLGALKPLAQSAGRIVDVGAGTGHLSRMAAGLFSRETWALDRDSDRLRSGKKRNEKRTPSVDESRVHFVQIDVGRQALALEAHDLAIGLHACGELGDQLVRVVSSVGCDATLISCCLQKTRADLRSSLSRAAAGLHLERNVLGLTNLVSRPLGVEATLAENLAARETRLALRYLLAARGFDVGAGEEMRGVNRRRARAGLDELARHALGRSGLPAPTLAELQVHAAQARCDYASMRRLALPRNMLARLVELAVVLDRAALLEEHGLFVRLAEFVEQSVTPRNTVLFASRQLERLPLLMQH